MALLGDMSFLLGCEVIGERSPKLKNNRARRQRYLIEETIARGRLEISVDLKLPASPHDSNDQATVTSHRELPVGLATTLKMAQGCSHTHRDEDKKLLLYHDELDRLLRKC